jgi:hypothetical protein
MQTAINTNGDLISLNDKGGRLSAYFIWNDGDGKFLNFKRPHGDAQERIRLADLQGADYIEGDIGVPIFSSRAKEFIDREFPGEMVFHEISIDCRSESIIFYLGKTMKYEKLIDESKSVFRTLPDGDKILTKPAYVELKEATFGLARDVVYSENMVVSQKFVEIAQWDNLRIKFSKLT